MRIGPLWILGCVAIGVVVVVAAPRAAGDPPADGFYRALPAEGPAPGFEPRPGEALPLKIDQALLAAKDNENEAFSLELRVPYDATLSQPESLFLVVGGQAFVSSGAGASGTTWSHPSFRLRGREAAEAAAKFLGITPRMRRHPGHRIEVRFVPSKAVVAAGEAVRVTFRMRNAGDAPVSFEKGGRQRAPRDNQYDFLARLRGQLVPDVGTNLHFGGESYVRVLPPGEAFEEEVDLGKWFSFAETGLYEVLGTYALTLLDPAAVATGDRATVWEDYATASFLVHVEGSGATHTRPPAADSTRPDAEGAYVGPWSDVVGHLRGRLVTAMDDRERGTRFVSVYLELQHVHYYASDVVVPVERRLEIEVLDEEGKSVPSQGLPWGGPVGPERPLVVSNHGRVRHKISGGGCGAPAEGAVICFPSGSWVFPKGESGAYSVRATLSADGNDRPGAPIDGWSGRMELPSTRVDLDPD